MKMIKLTDDNHKRLGDLSKDSGIPMTRLINGLISGMSARDIINAYSSSIIAIFEKKVNEK